MLKVARVKEQFLKVLPTFSQNYSIIALVIRLFILIQFPDNIGLCHFLSILEYGRKNSGCPLMIFSRAFYLKVASQLASDIFPPTICTAHLPFSGLVTEIFFRCHFFSKGLNY